ncbi:acidic leucine-rich nuclear phosphoprotein 32 family member B-like [Cynara cardunculus var. scolymus]|uniref:acidic leucine-rich nuclear phosphoprotein 32 family member B-like n=1 Tax=Cynara cardunculus var. scolymus TaxID=59895 RepID=UPI000D627DD9|nr:acidic leucine-rich nuclear phosphoprotein 32 family member B-like [Cynara cardunculus var. scolymus]
MVVALASQAEEVQDQLTRHGELLHQIFQLLLQLASILEPAFAESNRKQLEQVAEFNIMQAEALSNLEQCVEDISLSLNDLILCLDNDKEGEKEKSEKIDSDVTTDDDEALDVLPHVDEIPAAEDSITTGDAKAEDDDDDVVSLTTHENLPSTSTLQDASDEEENDEEEDEDEEY